MKVFCLLALSISFVTSPDAFAQKRDSLPIHQHWSGSQSGVKKADQKIVKSKKAWKKLWKNIHRNVSPQPKLPKVDFQKHSVVAVFMGKKPTAGYNTKIVALHKRKKSLVISYHEIDPPRGSLNATVITTPYDVVLVDRIVSKVRFQRTKKHIHHAPWEVPVQRKW